MNGFTKLMASPFGRIARVVAGVGIIAWGLVGIGDTNGMIVAAVGVLPILTGLLNICVVAPLMGDPLSGAKS